MPRIYVYSTLAADQAYSLGDPEKTLVIAGKANVANKHFLTPRGVATAVTEEQLHLLRQDRVFAAHLANEFLAISVAKKDPDDMAASMNSSDAGQQSTPESLAKQAEAAAKAAGASKKPAQVKAKPE
ncbi:hypothetical protein B2_45 [Stenotrophomonas phage B2]|nr:hypothetical protein B2_45 [Stenotrophomonas phage B2]